MQQSQALAERVRQHCPPLSPLGGVQWLWCKDEDPGFTIPTRDRDVPEAHLSVDRAVQCVEIGEGAVLTVVACSQGSVFARR